MITSDLAVQSVSKAIERRGLSKTYLADMDVKSQPITRVWMLEGNRLEGETG